jgi:hypothetical protein
LPIRIAEVEGPPVKVLSRDYQEIPAGKDIAPMSLQSNATPRKLQAAILGFGLDGGDAPTIVITGDHSKVLGGSPETHSKLLDAMNKLEGELFALGRNLADLNPSQLTELARRIDLPELEEIANRLQDGIASTGVAFEDLSAEELTTLSTGPLFSY